MQYLSRRLEANSKWPRGGQVPADVTAARQRERLLDATEALVAARGFATTSIERIAKEARVSTTSFYEHFAGKEECFAAAFERALADLHARFAVRVPAELPWPEQIRAGLRELLAAIAESPQRARMCLVQAPRGGPALLATYERALWGVVPKLREGRALDPAAAGLSDTLEEATIGGLAWLLRDRLEGGEADGIEAMLPELVDVALAPYLGPEEALALAGVGEGVDDDRE